MFNRCSSLRPTVGAITFFSALAMCSASTIVSLDGASEWRVAFDPKNAGLEEKWWQQARPEAKPVRVPGIYQEVWPGCRGVAWYWREVAFPANPEPDGRTLLRFWQADYLTDVWVNGVPVGRHEGGEETFTLDVTEAAKPGEVNRIAVRVLSPGDQPIDGMTRLNTPQRGRACTTPPGGEYQCGGLIDSVELLVCPAVRIGDLYVKPDWQSGEIRVVTTVRNAGKEQVTARIRLVAAPAAAGETLAAGDVEQAFAPGDTRVEAVLKVPQPRLWKLNDPFLYRVTASLSTDGRKATDDVSTRCGFRDFRFADGAFRLNGKRIFLRCSHTGNTVPAPGYRIPADPDLLRRDLLNAKAMGFNMIRFFCSIPRRYQLDLCDEIGLLVYEESAAGWLWIPSPEMPERFNAAVRGMIVRDRNHPSIVMWGLLNETSDGLIFRHAVALLPLVKELDDTRVTMLNSGLEQFVPRAGRQIEGLVVWSGEMGPEPCAAYNEASHDIHGPGNGWKPGQVSLHPGPAGQYGVLRWTAPQAGQYTVKVSFAGIAEKTTTDVHVLHQGKAIFDGGVNIGTWGNEAACEKTLSVQVGDAVDFVVGWGNGSYGGDTTAVAATLRLGETVYDVGDFPKKPGAENPWSPGCLAAGDTPLAATFKPLRRLDKQERAFGALCNPGQTAWEDTLSDEHRYQRYPHLAAQIRSLRDYRSGRPEFLSEYGVGSAVNLTRQVRHYEQIGYADSEAAQLYRGFLDRFMADWQRWNMADTFASPEDYFGRCVAQMAGMRLEGLNAIRANPVCVGHSMSGTFDHGFCGEGVMTSEFRVLKPGVTDAVFDGFYPLRLCLFTEPKHAYRGAKVRLDAVLANEDALLPGEYPIRLQIVGPDGRGVFDAVRTVTIQDPAAKPESPLALPFFGEEVAIDGPTGKYRFLATFQKGGAAAGGGAEFYVTDPADLPKVEADVALWGDDPALAKWLADHGIKTHPLAPDKPVKREAILVGRQPAAGDAAAWRGLARSVAQGSTAVFLSPEVFKSAASAVAWVPLANKGSLGTRGGWLYRPDHWAKRHPLFDGLQAGGLLDYALYQNVISDTRWAGLDAPAEVAAVSIDASFNYDSGLLLGVYRLGAGRLVLNTFSVCEQLGQDPAAERLLRNMLRYAAAEEAQPLADVPPDFEKQLTAMGY